MDVNRMTVTELREELKKRKLATSGVKAQLSERLKAAVAAEATVMNNSLTTSPTPVRSASQVESEEPQADLGSATKLDNGSEGPADTGGALNEEARQTVDEVQPVVSELDNNGEGLSNGAHEVDAGESNAAETAEGEEALEDVNTGNGEGFLASGEMEDEDEIKGIDKREERDARIDASNEHIPEGESAIPVAENEHEEQTADSAANVSDANVTERKLFIGGLQPRATDTDLEKYFAQFGPIERVLVKMDPVTKRSRGFGFVTFMDKETLAKVLEQEEHVICGRRVDCKQADGRPPANANARKGPGAPPASRKLFIGGIEPDATSDSELRELFGQFGTVAELDWPTDRASGKKRVFCFVQYEKGESIDKALKVGKIKIGSKEVDIKLATPKAPQRTSMGGGDGGRGPMGGRGGSSGGSGAGGNWNNFGWGGNAGGNWQNNMGAMGGQNWGNDWNTAMDWANAAYYANAFGGFGQGFGDNMMAQMAQMAGGGPNANWNNWNQGAGGMPSGSGGSSGGGGSSSGARSQQQRGSTGSSGGSRGGGSGAGGGRGRYHPYHRN